MRHESASPPAWPGALFQIKTEMSINCDAFATNLPRARRPGSMPAARAPPSVRRPRIATVVHEPRARRRIAPNRRSQVGRARRVGRAAPGWARGTGLDARHRDGRASRVGGSRAGPRCCGPPGPRTPQPPAHRAIPLGSGGEVTRPWCSAPPAPSVCTTCAKRRRPQHCLSPHGDPESGSPLPPVTLRFCIFAVGRRVHD